MHTKAFTYLQKQWDALNEYCRNGWVETDNNLCENAFRGVALGRHNYMFFGSDSGGGSAAVMYSLIGSYKLNSIEPEAWLRHVISVINTWPASRVKEMLPWNVLCKLILPNVLHGALTRRIYEIQPVTLITAFL